MLYILGLEGKSEKRIYKSTDTLYMALKNKHKLSIFEPEIKNSLSIFEPVVQNEYAYRKKTCIITVIYHG